ncbi:MAG: amidohydrolase family protein [Actinobacteria bacterium]|nr:amidohydrolase family protein [Actinomycetota bacterium]
MLPGRAVAGPLPGRGLALRGTVWTGGAATPIDGVVVVAGDGTVAAVGPVDAVGVPADLPVLGDRGWWIGPGVIDAHAHLALAEPEQLLVGGVVGVRDLGAPRPLARAYRTGPDGPPPARPVVAVAGPVLTAPGGYPSRSWGAAGFAEFVDTPERAEQIVAGLAADGVDLIKIALEPGPGWPVPSPRVVRAVVEAAHARGLPVVAHALTVDLVGRALDAGVDELAHVPVERLPPSMVDRLAAAGIVVVSTLQTFFACGEGPTAAANAAELVRAGVRLVYGTDLGNVGTRPGVDPRELDRLAASGLGRLGALRAATEGAARVAGVAGRHGRTGRIEAGGPAVLVVLSGDPLVEPGVWWCPRVVVCDGRVVT